MINLASICFFNVNSTYSMCWSVCVCKPTFVSLFMFAGNVLSKNKRISVAEGLIESRCVLGNLNVCSM